MKPCLIAIVLALGAFDAGAQTIFKSIMPDGKVVYGEKPAPGAQNPDYSAILAMTSCTTR